MNQRFPVIYSDAFLAHDTGPGHPENAGRLTAIVKALRSQPWANRLEWCSPTSLTQRDPLPWVEAVHHPAYVNALKAFAQKGGGHLDADTLVSPASYDVALLAVNAWLDGVDRVLSSHQSALVLARPPGHHALRDRGMGFCLLGNVAIATHYALSQPHIHRVAILDWDVHHGNGTQALVDSNPQVAYCSLHQFPAYPGTGSDHETGLHQNVLNIPMTRGSNRVEYEARFQQMVIPFLKNFHPDLLMVSAGYDATAADPLASMALNPADYEDFTDACLTLNFPTVLGLEGGYDYDALGQAVVATVEACLHHMV